MLYVFVYINKIMIKKTKCQDICINKNIEIKNQKSAY